MRFIDRDEDDLALLVEVLNDLKELGNLETLRSDKQSVAQGLGVLQRAHHRSILGGALRTG